MKISTIFAHCDEQEPLLVRVSITSGEIPYIEIGNIFGAWMSLEQLAQIRDAIELALAPSAALANSEAEVLEHAADNVRDSEPDIDDGFNAEAENEARVAPLDIDEVYF